MSMTSVNFKTVTTSCFEHNDRKQIISYLVKSSSDNYFNVSSSDAMSKYKELKKTAIKNYKKHVGRKPQGNTKYLKEALVVINQFTKPQQIEELAYAIEKKYGMTMLQYSLHLDEGKSEDELNLHAHITFFEKDLNTGKSVWRTFTKKQLTEFQDLAAVHLNMKRGISSKITGLRHLKQEDYKRQERAKDKSTYKIEKLEEIIEEQNREITKLKNSFERMIRNRDENFIRIEDEHTCEVNDLYEDANYFSNQFEMCKHELNLLEKKNKELIHKNNENAIILNNLNKAWKFNVKSYPQFYEKMNQYANYLAKYNKEKDNEFTQLEKKLSQKSKLTSDLKNANETLEKKLNINKKKYNHFLIVLKEIKKEYLLDAENAEALKIKLFEYTEDLKTKIKNQEAQVNEYKANNKFISENLNFAETKNYILSRELEDLRNENLEALEFNCIQNVKSEEKIVKKVKSVGRSR